MPRSFNASEVHASRADESFSPFRASLVARGRNLPRKHHVADERGVIPRYLPFARGRDHISSHTAHYGAMSAPGVAMCFSRAFVKGLLRPSPSRATTSGWVAYAIIVPIALCTAPSPFELQFLRLGSNLKCLP